MIHPSLPLLLSLASLFLSASTAPTRTVCRCSAITNADELTSNSTPVLSHSSPDPCADLGPSLEYFRHEDPEAYQSYFLKDQPTPTDEDQPLTTSVLLQLAARHRLSKVSVELPSAPTERPRERIVCRSEPEAISEFQDSKTSLFVLQVIVAMAFLACIAECISLLCDWVTAKKEETPSPALRLVGEEQRLRAYSAPCPMYSPGMDKKLQAYAALDAQIVCSEKRNVAVAYEDDEDDELNRPVM